MVLGYHRNGLFALVQSHKGAASVRLLLSVAISLMLVVTYVVLPALLRYAGPGVATDPPLRNDTTVPARAPYRALGVEVGTVPDRFRIEGAVTAANAVRAADIHRPADGQRQLVRDRRGMLLQEGITALLQAR